MKTTFFSILFLAAFGLRAQPSVVASSGGFAANATASVSWTLGELSVRTGGGANGILTQGFQQPEPSGIISDTEPSIFEQLLLFPNPTEAIVTLSFSTKKAVAASWEIISVEGRTVFESEKIDIAAGDFSKKIDLSRLAAGPYFLMLKNEKGQCWTARLLKI